MKTYTGYNEAIQSLGHMTNISPEVVHNAQSET